MVRPLSTRTGNVTSPGTETGSQIITPLTNPAQSMLPPCGPEVEVEISCPGGNDDVISVGNRTYRLVRTESMLVAGRSAPVPQQTIHSYPLELAFQSAYHRTTFTSLRRSEH
mgnify:CR=1 FL=1